MDLKEESPSSKKEKKDKKEKKGSHNIEAATDDAKSTSASSMTNQGQGGDPEFPKRIQRGTTVYKSLKHMENGKTVVIYLPDVFHHPSLTLTQILHKPEISQHTWRAKFDSGKGKFYFVNLGEKSSRVWKLPQVEENDLAGVSTSTTSDVKADACGSTMTTTTPKTEEKEKERKEEQQNSLKIAGPVVVAAPTQTSGQEEEEVPSSAIVLDVSPVVSTYSKTAASGQSAKKKIEQEEVQEGISIDKQKAEQGDQHPDHHHTHQGGETTTSTLKIWGKPTQKISPEKTLLMKHHTHHEDHPIKDPSESGTANQKSAIIHDDVATTTTPEKKEESASLSPSSADRKEEILRKQRQVEYKQARHILETLESETRVDQLITVEGSLRMALRIQFQRDSAEQQSILRVMEFQFNTKNLATMEDTHRATILDQESIEYARCHEDFDRLISSIFFMRLSEIQSSESKQRNSELIVAEQKMMEEMFYQFRLAKRLLEDKNYQKEAVELTQKQIQLTVLDEDAAREIIVRSETQSRVVISADEGRCSVQRMLKEAQREEEMKKEKKKQKGSIVCNEETLSSLSLGGVNKEEGEGGNDGNGWQVIHMEILLNSVLDQGVLQMIQCFQEFTLKSQYLYFEFIRTLTGAPRRIRLGEHHEEVFSLHNNLVAPLPPSSLSPQGQVQDYVQRKFSSQRYGPPSRMDPLHLPPDYHSVRVERWKAGLNDFLEQKDWLDSQLQATSSIRSGSSKIVGSIYDRRQEYENSFSQQQHNMSLTAKRSEKALRQYEVRKTAALHVPMLTPVVPHALQQQAAASETKINGKSHPVNGIPTGVSAVARALNDGRGKNYYSPSPHHQRQSFIGEEDVVDDRSFVNRNVAAALDEDSTFTLTLNNSAPGATNNIENREMKEEEGQREKERQLLAAQLKKEKELEFQKNSIALQTQSTYLSSNTAAISPRNSGGGGQHTYGVEEVEEERGKIDLYAGYVAPIALSSSTSSPYHSQRRALPSRQHQETTVTTLHESLQPLPQRVLEQEQDLVWDDYQCRGVLLSYDALEAKAVTHYDLSGASSALRNNNRNGKQEDEGIRRRSQETQIPKPECFAVGMIGIGKGQFVWEVKLTRPPAPYLQRAGMQSTRIHSSLTQNSELIIEEDANSLIYVGMTSRYFQGRTSPCPAYFYRSDGRISCNADGSDSTSFGAPFFDVSSPFAYAMERTARVTIHLNMNLFQMSLYVNGVYQGVAFRFSSLYDPEPLFPVVMFTRVGDRAVIQPPTIKELVAEPSSPSPYPPASEQQPL